MHHSIQSRRDIVDGLHQRSRIATADFYRLIGRPEPVVTFRMVVKPTGRDFFHVVDTRTKKSWGFAAITTKLAPSLGARSAYMPTSYADSAQARESDRRWDLPSFGKKQHADLFHEYTAEDLAGREEQRIKERASLKLRIGLAMTQMEAICPPAGGYQ